MDLSLVVITSPFKSMPSTSLINYVIKSAELIDGIQISALPIKIVFDGFKIGVEDRFKRGRITTESQLLYDQYYENLANDFKDYPNVELLRSEEHLGFAFSVKKGLEACTTKYALIIQHDRCFTTTFDDLPSLFDMMERYDYIRYIGFPSMKNMTHDRTIFSTYRLNCLTFNPEVKLHIHSNLYLQPLIFWYDSQHLCHVERYLNIYKPYKTFPEEFREIVGLKALKSMLLKPGDFIEDKFGQQQRNILSQLRQENYPDEVIIRLFRWYGSFLCWINDEEPYNEKDQESLPKASTKIMVRHLNGREFNYEKLLKWVKMYGARRIKSKRFLEIFCFNGIEGEIENDGELEETKEEAMKLIDQELGYEFFENEGFR